MKTTQCFKLLVLFFLLVVGVAGARAATENPLSLAGEWRFALDRSTEQREAGATTPVLTPGDGVTQEWFKRDLPDRIQLPGVLQSQGYGNDISTNTPWVLALGDAWWKIQPASLREHFSQPGHVEVPFLSQPPKHYLGAAWYQRDIDIPTNWQGRHFTLFLERAHWQSTVWVDDKQFPANDSLVAPHITDLGVLTPGKHRLSIRVDNRTQLPAQGHLVDGHSVSDSLGATWNGIVGKIELRSTPPVWIEDVQVFPTVTDKHIRVVVRIGNLSGKPGQGFLFHGIGNSLNSLGTPVAWETSLNSFGTPVVWETNGGVGEMGLSLSADTKAWSEFAPELKTIFVFLADMETNSASSSTAIRSKLPESFKSPKTSLSFLDVRDVTFGFREI